MFTILRAIKNMRKISYRDLAERVGVSVSTAKRVVNNRTDISLKTYTNFISAMGSPELSEKDKFLLIGFPALERRERDILIIIYELLIQDKRLKEKK